MTARRKTTRKRTRITEPAIARRITFGGRTFACYDQQQDQRPMVVMEERIIQLTVTTYALFVTLLERAAQPSTDAIVAVTELLAIALLGDDAGTARPALRKRLYALRTKIEAFGLEVACVQERHAAVGYVLRLADDYAGKLSA